MKPVVYQKEIESTDWSVCTDSNIKVYGPNAEITIPRAGYYTIALPTSTTVQIESTKEEVVQIGALNGFNMKIPKEAVKEPTSMSARV